MYCFSTDTLAGQMNALKSSGMSGAAPQRRSRKPVLKEESSDESDTEGEEESESDTDTDTDSDEE